MGIPFGELAKDVNSKKTKNSVGDLFESWFGKARDSASEPDLGVSELKATPYIKRKGGQYSAKERLVLNIINYQNLADEEFETSHFYHKNKVIELAFYEYIKDKPRSEWTFSEVALFEMAKNPTDYAIIRNDWDKIQRYVKEGHAENLTESLTDYLAACTKGANAQSLRTQPYSDVKAKQRAFSLKTSYMTQLLREYILGDKKSDFILKNSREAADKSLADVLIEKLSPYFGQNSIDICTELGVIIRPGIKNYNSLLIRAMLGFDTSKKSGLDNISELNKASYLIKTVQFDYAGTNSESMSFPSFKFKDLVQEQWKDEDNNPSAKLNILMSESTFVFAIFQHSSVDNDESDNVFKGIKFYKMPQAIINNEIYCVWQDTIDTLNEGVKLWRDGRGIRNDFVNAGDQRVIHVRPHAGYASYIDNGYANELPVPSRWLGDEKDKPRQFSSQYMTNQCFFLNNKFIREIVRDLVQIH